MLRLLKLGIYDPAYLEGFYGQRPGLAEMSYAGQHQALIEDRAASSDFWTSSLSRIGYETSDVVANAVPLQHRWAAENGVMADRADDPFTIAVLQIRAFAPDILLVADYSTFGPAFLRALRAECPSIRRIAGWCGAPFNDLSVMREWDLAFSCVPELVAQFRSAGIAAHHVDHGFAPHILDQLTPAKGTPAFSFLGSIVKLAGFHGEREKLLVRLLAETPLEIWSSSARRRGMTGIRDQLLSLARRAPGRRRKASLHPLIVRRARPPRYGLAMFQKLRDSQITLNTHIDVSVRSASNMRLFEATGVGTCLLTDRKDDLNRLFEPGLEIVTYGCADEAIEKYRYLADNPRERSAIAAAGQRRTFRDHNFDRRAERIDDILRASLQAA